jgi:hypothetical protein
VSTTDISTPTRGRGDDAAAPAAERAEVYLADVGRHLADLTDDERDDLLDDLTAHVHQVAAGDDRPLDDVLGTPEAFAAELRASAGLAPGRSQPGLVGRTDRAYQRLRTTTSAVLDHPWARSFVAFLPELRPAWWVARGWLIVYGLWLVSAGDDPSELDAFPLPEVFGSAVVGAIALVAASLASVRLARRDPAPRWRWVVNAAGVVGALVLLVSADDLERSNVHGYRDETAYTEPRGYQLTHPDGSAITNVYAYDADGEPLDQVLLYDQHGRPIELGDAVDPATGLPFEQDLVLDQFGLPVRNLYPIDQHAVAWGADGQAHGRRPVPRPDVVVPSLAPGATPGGSTDATEPTGGDASDGSDGSPDGTPSTTATSDSPPPTTVEGS